MPEPTSPALAADVLRGNDGLIRIKVDLPGPQPAVAVRVHGHTVVLDAHRAVELPCHYLLHERTEDFRREFHLPRETDMRNVNATIHDGVLTISAPVGAGHEAPGQLEIEVRPSGWACHPDAAAI